MIRHFPFYAPLALPDFEYCGVKLAVLFGGLALYFAMTALAAKLSASRFEKVDL